MELFHQIASVLYGSLCCFYFFFMTTYTKKPVYVKAVFKFLPLAVLVVSIMYVFEGDTKKYEKPFYGEKLTYSLWSILFAVIGDIYFIYSKTDLFFMYRLVSYTISNTLFALAFSYDGFLFFRVKIPGLVSFLFISSISTIVYYHLVSKLNRSQAIIVAVHISSLTALFWSGVLVTQSYISLPSVAGAVGTGLFYISDVLLAINKWRGPIPKADVLIMSTYYIAQFMITFSFVYFK